MLTDPRARRVHGAAAVVITGIVFAGDLALPLGVAAGVLYVIVILLTYRLPSMSATWLAASSSSVLIGAGFALSPPGGIPWVVLTNRALALVPVWVAAWLVIHRKRALRRLAAREAEISAVIAGAIDGIVTMDEQGLIESFNPAAEKIFDYAAAEVVGRNVKMLMPEPYRGAHDGYIAAYRATGVGRIIGEGREVEGRRRDGSRFPIDLAVTEVHSPGRRKLAGFLRDITARKRAEAKAAAGQRALAEGARLDRLETEALVALNRHGGAADILRGVLEVVARDSGVRPAAAYLFDDWQQHLTLAASYGLPAGHPEVLAPGEGLAGEAAAAGDLLIVADPAGGLVLETGVGHVRPAAIAAVPLCHQERTVGVIVAAFAETPGERERALLTRLGAQIGAALDHAEQHARLVALTDELNQKSEQLARNNAELARADRMKSTFLANMSHELRTPLNAIIGFAEVLYDGALGALAADQADYVGEIFSAGQHLLSLINDVLDLSKVDAGRMELDLEEIDVATLAHNAITIVKEQALHGGVELSCDVEAEIPELSADARKLRQILYNLLANAVKFTPEGGAVSLSVRRRDGAVEFAVRDTGVGIAPEERQTIFEPFAQLDDSASREYEGTGLGLALVRRLVQLHGGRVDVESEPGAGSCFVVSIPSAPPSVRPRTAPAPRPAGATLCLLIEDEDTAAELLAGHLRRAGYAVIRRASAEAGLAAIADEPPDVILLDILLPDTDGWEVLRAVKADPRAADIPVVVVSVVADDNRERGLLLGAAEVMQKPVGAGDLLATIRNAGIAPGRGATVLVVDDDPRAVEIVAGALERRGCTVLRALGGDAALALAAATPPDLVILDLMMPGMSGLELLARLRGASATSATPVIVLTAQHVDEVQRRELAAATTAVLHKHELDVATLLAMVRRALRPARCQASPGDDTGRLLLVAPAGATRDRLRGILEDGGYRVVCAAGAAAARARIAAQAPHLVILGGDAPADLQALLAETSPALPSLLLPEAGSDSPRPITRGALLSRVRATLAGDGGVA